MKTTTAAPRAARVRAAAGHGSRRHSLRLTRRGRGLVMTVVLATSLAGGMALSEKPSLAAGESAPQKDPTFVVVQPGQTLWEIARVAAPGVDPRATIGRILDLNALPGVDIRAGQRLALP
jgi:nucleoid-associated protein YgaU